MQSIEDKGDDKLFGRGRKKRKNRVIIDSVGEVAHNNLNISIVGEVATDEVAKRMIQLVNCGTTFGNSTKPYEEKVISKEETDRILSKYKDNN